MPGGSFDPFEGIYTPPPPGAPDDTPDLPGHISNPVTGAPMPGNTPVVPPAPPAPAAPPTTTPPADTGPGITTTDESMLPDELKKQLEEQRRLLEEAKKNPSIPVYPGNGGGGTGGQSDTGRRDSLARLRTLFASYGLPDTLSDWAWQRLQDGAGEDEVALSLRDTPEFKTRFPAIDARVKAGLSPISPAEYVAYESQFRQMMSRAGLPPSFYDQTSDMTQFIADDVSLAELSDRIQQGFMAVKSAPREVRDEFARLYGVDGDAALAAYVLDRSRSEDALTRAVAGAQAAGVGWTYGFRLDRTQADLLGDKGLTQAQLDQGFKTLQSLNGLFARQVGDIGDLSSAREGFGAIFGHDQAATDAITMRVGQRTNQSVGTASTGAAVDKSGLYASKAVK